MHGSESPEFRASVSRLPVGLSTPVAGVCREFVDLPVRDWILELGRSEPGEEITFSEALQRVASQLAQWRERGGGDA